MHVSQFSRSVYLGVQQHLHRLKPGLVPDSDLDDALRILGNILIVAKESTDTNIRELFFHHADLVPALLRALRHEPNVFSLDMLIHAGQLIEGLILSEDCMPRVGMTEPKAPATMMCVRGRIPNQLALCLTQCTAQLPPRVKLLLLKLLAHFSLIPSVTCLRCSELRALTPTCRRHSLHSGLLPGRPISVPGAVVPLSEPRVRGQSPLRRKRKCRTGAPLRGVHPICQRSLQHTPQRQNARRPALQHT